MLDRLLKRSSYLQFFKDFDSSSPRNWELCVSDNGFPYLWNHVSYPSSASLGKSQAQVLTSTEEEIFFFELESFNALGISSGESHGVFAVPKSVVTQVGFAMVAKSLAKINKKLVSQVGA